MDNLNQASDGTSRTRKGNCGISQLGKIGGDEERLDVNRHAWQGHSVFG